MIVFVVEAKVEIDETFIVRRKYNKGRLLKQLLLFGRIERLTYRRLVIPLNLMGEKRNKDTRRNVSLFLFSPIKFKTKQNTLNLVQSSMIMLGQLTKV